MKNLNLKTLLPYAVIFGLCVFLFLYVKKAQNLKHDLASEVKLKMALIDTVDRYVNKEKELVAEKLTLQTNLKDLSKINDDLTSNQQELLRRIKEESKKNTIINAALIKSQVIIDSLKHKGTVDVDLSKNTVTFADKTKDLAYNIKVSNVRPIEKLAPTLSFDNFALPNTQYVKFSWKNDKKEGYPISFSVSNSNPYFTTANIDSYAIPELEKPFVKPTFWQKNGHFIKQGGTILVSVGIGAMIVLLFK